MKFSLAPPHVLSDITNFTLTQGSVKNHVLGRPVGKRIRLGFRLRDNSDEKEERYGTPTKSCSKINDELVESGRGPMVAIGMFRDVIQKVEKPTDLTMEDFRHVVDHLRLHYDQNAPARQTGISEEEIQAVRINCVGDVAVFRRPEFEQTTVNLATFPMESTPLLHGPDELGLPYGN